MVDGRMDDPKAEVKADETSRERPKKMSINMPMVIYRALRLSAFEDETTMTEIVLRALAKEGYTEGSM